MPARRPVREREKEREKDRDNKGRDTDRQFVTALERGLQVLRAFSRKQGGLRNGQLAKQTKLAPSTISRLVYTLRELGYLRYDRASRSYMLMPQVLSLGYPVLSQAPLLHQVRPILLQLAQETGETCGFAQRDGLHATFLDCVQGRNMLAVRMEIGARLPLSNSASGLCLIKASSEADRRFLLQRIRATLARRRLPVAAFDQCVKDALASPAVILRDSWHKGIGGVSVPVGNGSEIGAITIPVATSNVSEREMRSRLGDRMLELADRHALCIR